MNNDVTILKIHMLVISTLQHHMFLFLDWLKKLLRLSHRFEILTYGVALLILRAYDFLRL